jgi:hypothetical protein
MNLPTILTIVFIGALLRLGFDLISVGYLLAAMFWGWLMNRGKG